MEGTLARMCPTKPVCGAPARSACAGMCARLRRSLYGTRDAPARWEAFLSKQLESMGFARGLASPCCYRHCSKRFLLVWNQTSSGCANKSGRAFLFKHRSVWSAFPGWKTRLAGHSSSLPGSVGGRYACTCSLAQTGSRMYVARVDIPAPWHRDRCDLFWNVLRCTFFCPGWRVRTTFCSSHFPLAPLCRQRSFKERSGRASFSCISCCR